MIFYGALDKKSWAFCQCRHCGIDRKGGESAKTAVRQRAQRLALAEVPEHAEGFRHDCHDPGCNCETFCDCEAESVLFYLDSLGRDDYERAFPPSNDVLKVALGEMLQRGRKAA